MIMKPRISTRMSEISGMTVDSQKIQNLNIIQMHHGVKSKGHMLDTSM